MKQISTDEKSDLLDGGPDVSTGRYDTYLGGARTEYLETTEKTIREKLGRLQSGEGTVATFNKAIALLKKYEEYGGNKETAKLLYEQLQAYNKK